eukprot:gene11825-8134_t
MASPATAAADAPQLTTSAEGTGGTEDGGAGSSYAAPASLRDRLEARHKKALEEFQRSIRQLNDEADQRQHDRVFGLKDFLSAQHAEAKATLEAEAGRVATHHNYLEAFAQETLAAPLGDVRPALVDLYHSPSDLDLVACRERMQGERERLLQVSTWVRRQYHDRQDAITACVEQLDAEELERRQAIQESLRQLMVQLAQTSFCSITASHVIAQRVIHHVNEQLASNHLCSRTLLSQLRRREVLKLGAYNKMMANVYTSLREGMAKSAMWWLRSLLQSPHYRRPRARMEEVEEIARVCCDAQREAKHFLSSLVVTLQSLRESRDTRQHESRIVQPLGGTHPAGWLRHYDENLFSDPFPTDPSEVVDEWRMKAIVVVRNSLASIVSLNSSVAADEALRVQTAARLLEAYKDEMEWLFTPLPGAQGELEMLKKASLSCYELDACFQPLVEPDHQRMSLFHDMGRQTASPALAALEAECSWFQHTVETGLQESHRIFEESILLAYKSVLRQFEKATEALVCAVRGTYGVVRRLFQKQEEARQDYEDHLSLLEEDFEVVTNKLTHAASMNTAHELFAEGIDILEKIAKCYTSYNKQFLQELAHLTSEAAVKTAEVYEFLTGKLGVENAADTQDRLVRERQKRTEDAMAKLLQDQSHSKKGARGKKKSESTPTPNLEGTDQHGASLTATQAQQLAQIEADMEREPPPQYPQIQAATASPQDGTGVFNVIHPVYFIEDIVQPPHKDELEGSLSSRSSFGRRKGGKRKAGSPNPAAAKKGGAKKGAKKGGGSASKEDVEALSSLDATGGSGGPGTLVPVEREFIASYNPLFETNIAHPECFIEQTYITDWMETMRREILNWLLVLRRDTAQGIQEYVQRSASEAEVNINFLLRNHRRRPATFQADIYEARVRELENKSTQSEKYCARLMDRVAKLECTVQLLRHDPQQSTEDDKTLRDLADIEKKVEEASSKHVLQVLERRHAARQAHYIDSYGAQKQRVLEAADKQRELIESDAAHYLAERAKQLATEEYGEGTLEDAVERDTLCVRVRNILERLQSTMKLVRAYADREEEERRERMAEVKKAYDQLHQRSVDELKLLAFVQETFSRVKLQIQTVIQRSRAEEERVATAIKTVEETVLHPTPRPRTEVLLRSLFTKDYGLAEHAEGSAAGRRSTAVATITAAARDAAAGMPTTGYGQRHSVSRPSVGAGGGPAPVTSVPELPDDVEDQIREEMDAKMCLSKVQYQRLLQTCPAAELLAVLDQLRELLYIRGVSLNALSWAVELVRVQPEHYIEPKIPPKDAEGAANSGGGAGAGAGGKRRQPRSVKGVTSVALPMDPLPPATVMEAHVTSWIKNAQKEVSAAIQRHFATYPVPLLRSSPVLLKATSEEEVNAAVVSLSEAPHQRFMEHHRGAMVAYHEHVQRLFVALQLAPQFLTSSLLNLASTSLTNRIQSVMETCGQFYAHSAALMVQHQRLVKVALASHCHRDKLEHLDAVETMRQERTNAITTWLWGCAIREVQEEVGLHAARCIQTTSTFFQLLKGLTSPEHLTPCDVELTVGYHRGLKHLLRLREKDGRLRDLTDQEAGDAPPPASAASGGKGSGRGAAAANNKSNVPDAVPIFRTDTGRESRSIRESAGGKERGLVPDSNGTINVPVPQYGEPLDQFNSTHPNCVVAAPLAARLYFPPPAVEPAAQAAAQTSGRRGKRGAVKTEVLEESGLLSPPIIAPATRLHQQAVLFAGEALEELTRTATVVVKDANSAFQSMEERESQCAQRWLLTTNRLKRSGGPIAKTSGTGGLRRVRRPAHPAARRSPRQRTREKPTQQSIPREETDVAGRETDTQPGRTVKDPDLVRP